SPPSPRASRPAALASAALTLVAASPWRTRSAAWNSTRGLASRTARWRSPRLSRMRTVRPAYSSAHTSPSRRRAARRSVVAGGGQREGQGGAPGRNRRQPVGEGPQHRRHAVPLAAREGDECELRADHDLGARVGQVGTVRDGLATALLGLLEATLEQREQPAV